MVNPGWHHYNHRLTGNMRVRIGRFGRIILQVEESYQSYQWQPRPGDKTTTHYRDATLYDIQAMSPMRLVTK